MKSAQSTQWVPEFLSPITRPEREADYEPSSMAKTLKISGTICVPSLCPQGVDGGNSNFYYKTTEI
jgi:hypothetical protein